MGKSCSRENERGSAGVKLTIVLIILFLAANAGYNYIPTAYQAESFKSEMYTAVVQGVAMPNRGVTPVDSVKERLNRAARKNEIPPDAFMEVKQVNKRIQAHVVYTKPVSILPFGIYTYDYHFDYTATPTGFLLND